MKRLVHARRSGTTRIVEEGRDGATGHESSELGRWDMSRRAGPGRVGWSATGRGEANGQRGGSTRRGGVWGVRRQCCVGSGRGDVTWGVGHAQAPVRTEGSHSEMSGLWYWPNTGYRAHNVQQHKLGRAPGHRLVRGT